MIAFKTISYQNFLSTGNVPNVIQLNRSTSTLIIGKNGEGKSTILDALTFALFGKPFRNINKPQLCNSINQKNCLVELEFEIGTTSYKIRRGIKPNLFEIFCDGKMMNQDAAVKDYQKILEQQILKLNYKTFTQVVILGSASFVPFMQLPQTQRREVIEDILDISVFSTMNQILKERMNETKELLQSIDNKITISKTTAESQKKIIASLVSSKKEQVDSILTQISSNEEEIKKNTEVVTNLLEQIQKLTKECEDVNKLKKDANELNKLRAKLSTNKEKIEETLSFFEENTICPSCSQGIPHEHKDSIIKDIQSQCSSIDEKIITLEEANNRLQERQAKLDELNSEILSLNILVNSTNATNMTLNEQNKKLEKQIKEAKSDTSNIDAERKKLSEIVEEAMKLLEKKKELNEQRIIEDVSYNLLKDTGIKTAIIREYLPVMNKLINSYLNAMDFYVHFELDESFNEIIKSRHRDEFSYASFSEGEKMRIDLAILFTWRHIAKMKNSINTNLLILDEIFDSSLDNSGTDYFLSIMNAFGEKSNVFVISHKGDQLFDKFHSVIKFEKKGNFSVIA